VYRNITTKPLCTISIRIKILHKKRKKETRGTDYANERPVRTQGEKPQKLNKPGDTLTVAVQHLELKDNKFPQFVAALVKREFDP
jgi:hypothetical protein